MSELHLFGSEFYLLIDWPSVAPSSHVCSVVKSDTVKWSGC